MQNTKQLYYKILFVSNPVSGHGKDNVSILTEENKNPSGEDDLPLETRDSAGECVLGTGVSTIATSIHSIKVELNKMNAKKITMTLDCCRNVSRDAEAFVVYLKYKINIINYWLLDLASVLRGKEIIRREHHERMFILHGTMETLTAEDGKGGTFTQILSSVCKENGGAVDILEIEKFVFLISYF